MELKNTSHARVEHIFFWVLVVVVTALFAWTLQSFIMPIFSALVLAILFYPVFTDLSKTFPRYPSLASALTILLAILVVAVPLYALGWLLLSEAVGLYQNATFNPATFFSDTLARLPQVLTFAQGFGITEADLNARVAQAAQTASTWVLSFGAALTTQTIGFLVQFVISLYLMFFMLKDGPELLEKIGHAIPLSSHRRHTLFSRFVSTVRAVVKGSIVVSGIQGVIGGILFWIVGIPNPVLWGAVMAFLALLPFGGPTLVWLPAGIMLYLSGNISGAIIVIAGGALVVGLVDNVLRPILVGRDIKMPDPLVLIAVLGGLASFGPPGIIIGPIIAALFLSVWEMFAQERSNTPLTA